jgi:hypothetical protein
MGTLLAVEKVHGKRSRRVAAASRRAGIAEILLASNATSHPRARGVSR